ncbi:RNA-guided endonuclease InsQ/TnpB family protein [Streptacidiphilus sp. PAMC 29251]
MHTDPVMRAFKYRFYPTDGQAVELARTFGCVRLVYNRALQARSEGWTQRQERISYNATSAMLTAWKKTQELAFLTEVSSVPLQQCLRHLQNAFVNFWQGRAKYPTFKSKKKSRRSAEYTRSAFSYRDGLLKLAKMSAPLDIVWSRPLPEGASPSTVTVSQDSAGRWFVSLLCQDPAVQALPRVDTAVGLDAGISTLLTLSTGEKIANPKFEKADRIRLTRAQRALARKQKGSANRDKARLKVVRVHARISDRRRDFLHKITTRLVQENQLIVIEDLSVRNMLKNHTLARAVSDAAWTELRTQLTYKAHWYGRNLVVVDRWYPSSKTCSTCGYRARKLPLNIRTWICPACTVVHDRDVNAARNILAAGLAVNACGAGVRPQWSPPSGLLATKQEALAAK